MQYLFCHCLFLNSPAFGALGKLGFVTVLFSGVSIQSTLVISISKGLSEILRDIRTSTYQICRIEEKIIRTTPHLTNIYVIGLLKLEIY